MKNRKIALFMLPLLTQGAGAEKYFINLAKNLSDMGNEVVVITMDEKFFKKFARLLHIFTHGNFFKKIDVSGREKEADIKNQLGGARWIKSSWGNLKEALNGYDIIYSKNELVDLFILKTIDYKKIPPVVVGVHTPIIYPSTGSFMSKLHNLLYLSFIYKWLLRGAKCIHLSNEFTKKLVDKNFKIKSKKIYYPFSKKYLIIENNSLELDIKFDNNKINIVFIARLTEQKGINSLVRIVAAIENKKNITDKIILNIFGSGDHENELKIKNINDKYSFVRWHGHIENKYVPWILKKQDFFITTAKWETLPFNVLEAQALGLPVIAFDIPGPSDIIEDKKTGYLVKSEDEFIEKIILLTNNPHLFNNQSIEKNIDDKFNPEKIYEEILNMFNENI